MNAKGPPFAAGSDESAYFLAVNRNKHSLAVDMKHRSGQRILQELAAKADVLIENYLPGKLARYGLDYESLSAVNPRLIYASITGYGPDGPYAHKAGYDVIVEGEAGLMSITGEPDGPPVKGIAASCRLLSAETHLRTHSGRGHHGSNHRIVCARGGDGGAVG